MSSSNTRPNLIQRQIYLLIFPDPRFASHHALFIPLALPPSLSSNPTTTSTQTQLTSPTGKLINIEGSPFAGFNLCIERKYNISDDRHRPTQILLGLSSEENIKDFIDGDMDEVILGTEEGRWVDRFEEIVGVIEAPGGSLRGVDEDGPRTRIQIKNCQAWLRDYVDKLIEEGVLDEEARKILGRASRFGPLKEENGTGQHFR